VVYCRAGRWYGGMYTAKIYLMRTHTQTHTHISASLVCTSLLLIRITYSLIWAGEHSQYSNWLRAGRSGDWIPVGSEIFRTCPDRPWGPPSLLYNGYQVFPGGKEQPGRDADLSPPSSAVGHERVELYLYSHYGPYGLYRASVPVQGVHFTFYLTPIFSLKSYL
jgi:hypothetical protein